MPADYLLLLPGMMCDARLWAPQMNTLAVDCRVPDTTSADNFADMAAMVLADAPERFAVAGLSMGGILAFELWRQAPERISHLALIDTNPHADTPGKRTMRLDQIEQVLSGQLRALAVDSLKPAYLARAHRDDKELLGRILDMAMELGEDVFRRQSLALKDRVDSVATLPTITCPATVMCGIEDHICPVDYHQLMADRIPGARLLVIEDCGHLASLEQPRIVTDALRQLLEQ